MIKKALFLPGGPGLNSEPERRLLGGETEKHGFAMRFWDEPSALRPDGPPFRKERAFTAWLECAERAVDEDGPFDLLVGSSFGALGALHLLKRRPTAFSRLLLIAPTLDLFETFRRMMRIAAEDFREARPDLSRELLRLRSLTRSLQDPPMVRAMALVYQDPLLLSHYCRDADTLRAWRAVLGEPRYGIDGVSQAAVLDELKEFGAPWPAEPIGAELRVIVGAHDPVVREDEVMRQLRPRCERVELVRFADSSHFPHLEESGKFLECLRAFGRV